MQVGSANRVKRILIVEDLDDAAELLDLLLSHHGFEVRTAADGPSALAIAAQFAPEVALIDIALPGMNGYVVAENLRRQQPNIRLIAVTGFARLHDECPPLLFEVHLVKPVELRDLLRVVNEP